MNYDVILSIVIYVCGCFYMAFSASRIAGYVNNKINWLLVTFGSLLSSCSFSLSISNSVATAEASAFWRAWSVIGWGSLNSFLLHFILILTKKERRFNKRSMLIMLYLPALINVILIGPYGFFSERHYQMVQTDFGWVNMAPMHAMSIWLNAYYIVFSIASIILLIQWWRSIGPRAPEKREARRFILSVLFFFLIEAVISILPGIFGKKSFLPLTTVLFIVPIIMLFAVLKKLGFIEPYKKVFRLQEHSESLTDDRSRLFKAVTVIFEVSGALSFLVGYFSMKNDLGRELFHAGSLLLMGITVRSIPSITKKHAVQNTIFLAVSMLGVMYFVIANAATGALTVWTVYMLFLLFTVILDSTKHAYFFTALYVIVQVVFWIVRPEISVIIDGSEYLIRIIIIMLSFVTVRYLTKEYASKIEGFQRLAREQRVLEKISSSFISVNNENAYEKIDKMFETAVEILEFSQAFLIEFDKDYEDATIVSIYKKDVENESFSYHLGMKLKVKNSPMFQSLLDQKTSLICEDTTDISFDVVGRYRDYIKARGVNSFFAVPVEIDNEIGGVLIVEYNERMDDLSLAESRLNFLRIIANILGDARKKILFEERLYHFAYFDEATKLANRNMLRKRLGQLIHDRKGSEKIAIIDIELENLRMINDTFGHSIGEQIMIKSAAILEHMFKECCDISRASEGRFVVVLPRVKNNEQIEEFTKRLLDSFSHPVLPQTGIEALFVTVNIGISVYPDDGRDADTLLKNADLARYEANNSNEKVVYYTERLENHIAENTLFTNRLFRSLENKEFFLEFQPQISCYTGKTAGIEALLRWTSDGSKRVSPDRFIPILEQTGLIYDVGLWVLEQTLQEHNRLIAKGFPSLRVSVNLSVVQFQGEDFIPDFTNIIKNSGVNPKHIELEITESLFSKNPKDVLDKLYKLKELGVRIAIDDFGKGYSSLNRLKLVPFDRIKIDKEIIDYIDLERKKAPITESIILLARSFRAAITAEGVETKEQADFLRSITCDEIQGYYYSRPLSVEALEEFLKKESRGHHPAN
ncbi:MAG: EAL domain-containing protein [Christensenellales bacterium]